MEGPALLSDTARAVARDGGGNDLGQMIAAQVGARLLRTAPRQITVGSATSGALWLASSP